MIELLKIVDGVAVTASISITGVGSRVGVAIGKVEVGKGK